MREKSKNDAMVSRKDLPEEKVKNDGETRNNFEKDKEMKREPVEVTEFVAERKKLNITEEEDIVTKLDKLNIKTEVAETGEDELKKRGPTGGVPVNYCHPIEIKHIPVGPPLLPAYGNPQIYQQQQPNYAAQHGRRNLDEPEMPAPKFRAAPNFHPHHVSQMPHYDVSDFSQSHITPTFNPSLGYQPGQMFGLPQQQEKITLTMKNGTSGATVTVTTPTDMQFTTDPFEGFGQRNQNLADDLLEEWDRQDPQQFTSPNLLNAQMPLNNINQPGPTGYFQPQPQMSVQVSTPVTSANLQYNDFNNSGQSYRDPQSRRQSDPTDSGVESVGEASPYPESTPSPSGSTYTSPPSVESGYGRSPRYDAFSPDSTSQGSVGGSSPKYTGNLMSPGLYSDTASPGSGYGNVGAPQPMSDKNPSPGQDPRESQGTEESSKYIDENLDKLQDALNVIANDIKSDAQRKATKRQTEQQKRPVSQGNTFSNFPSTVPLQNPLPVQPVPSSAGTTNVIILPAQTQQAAVTAGNSVVLVPTGVILVPPQPNQKQPPKRKEPRKILPKMPAGTPNPIQNPGNNSVVSPAQPAVKNVKPQPPQNIQAIKQQQQKNLNIARRNVAGVKTENLLQVDEEGDMYLHIAVIKTDRFMIQALIERLRREGLMHLIDKENNKRQTPLFLAVAFNEPGKVQLLIKEGGANVNTLAQTLSSDGQTTEVKAAIHVASVGGKEYLKTLEELLKAPDVSINIVNNYGQTALHCAILAHGKERKGKDGGTVQIDSRPIIQALVKKGADPVAQDKKSGKTPLMYAIEHRNISLVETILGAVEPTKVRNVVKTQAFDGSSCLKIAEGIKKDFNDFEYNRLWDILQGAISGNLARIQPQVF